jgi:ADP-ribose pyrophosphatase YjhB (NUDIX family)
MKREVREELGIEIDIWGYLPHTDHIISSEKQHWVAFNFLASIESGTPKNLEPDKCRAIDWFPLDKLPDKLTQTTWEPIQNFLKKKYISEGSGSFHTPRTSDLINHVDRPS